MLTDANNKQSYKAPVTLLTACAATTAEGGPDYPKKSSIISNGVFITACTAAL